MNIETAVGRIKAVVGARGWVADPRDPTARSDRRLDLVDGRFDVHAYSSTRGHALRVVATNVVHLEERLQAVGRNWAQLFSLEDALEGKPFAHPVRPLLARLRPLQGAQIPPAQVVPTVIVTY